MKMATRKTVYVEVEVEPREVWEAFMNHFATMKFPDAQLRPSLSYSVDLVIDKDGRWSSWGAGHGSGYSQTHRLASDAEKEAMAQWKDLLKHRVLFSA